MKPPTTIKRLVFTAGGKGGTGKTTVANAIADFYQDSKISSTLYDADRENRGPGAFASYHGVRCKNLNVRERTGLDEIVNTLHGDASNVLCDLGAGSGKEIFEFVELMCSPIQSLGGRITMVIPIVDNASSLSSLLEWASMLREKVDYVVVRNPFIGESWELWASSIQAQRFRSAASPVVIDVPLIVHLNVLDAQFLTPSQFLHCADFKDLPAPLDSFSARVRIGSSWQSMKAEITKAKNLLVA